ncbi:hypothetical protein [Marinifilum flexuosum]|uniref:Holin n=1 Tax=Marinifilum flexuosum TaxID=1117708 RepID=A0A419X9I0_9BACT|nr:hypothetical protein [Marinifilum flexuosum]RKE04424.1 hypothetical protein BXY64_1444 [Marinifilum flexuosum]
MNKISSFVIGTLSTMGVVESLRMGSPNIQAVQEVPVDSTEALISVIGGAISTIIVALLKRWWKKLDERKKQPNTS